MVDLLFYLVTYCVIGAFAGLLAGIMGLGGGMIVVPGLFYIFHSHQIMPENLCMHFATATSLATMIFTANSAVRAHYHKGQILWYVFGRLWAGLSVGAVIGVLLAQYIPSEFLEILFGGFLLAVAFKMYKEVDIQHPPITPKTWLDRLVTAIVGLISGLLGVGGGTMIIPYLLYNGIPIRQTAAVSSLCTLVVALVGTIIIMALGGDDDFSLPYSSGFIYWPAVIGVVLPSYFFTPLGVKLAYILPVKQLKYAFIAVVLIVAFTMLR